ncbi:YqcC family protein [Yersinia rohdei]|uniref:YqcC family protein n=1 Tax=Yersinia rohdei TaxID=29485 RepID=UPI0025AB16E8|nr:YqcC family protein [Yersinia rohdei]MDN0096539.1 YqcC family protein [Yersinia rohdei]
MKTENQVRQSLQNIELAMREIDLWQTVPPQAAAFESNEPFSIDTMDAEQWLQWVLIPRMHALLESNGPLPTRFAITPYFEEALSGDNRPDCTVLLVELQRLDDLLNKESN